MRKSKPRLTRIVLEGLVTLAGVAEAGSAEDILGNDPDVDLETRETWRRVERAVYWIRAMQEYKEQ